ncbi:hypothetical protein [Amycolatopsis sp. NPDC051071]|uniref:hypothetical protein n=1 Tax=Amycolatopsis sp. NPDC051071 TaxID=3154637 RepID=UPI00341FAEF4
MDTPPGQDPQPFQQQSDAPPTVVSVAGPTDPVEVPGRPGRSEPRRLVAAGLATLALVLTLVGCFFPFFITEHRLGFDRSEKIVVVVVQGAWETKIVQDDGPSLVVASSPVGIPLLVAAAILLAAAIVSVRAARLRRPDILDRWLTTIAAVFLTGAVATATTMLGFGRQLGEPTNGTLTFGAGIWALFAAVVAAVGAAVMSHRVDEGEIPVSEAPGLADLPTPKDGISIMVLPPEPRTEAPPDYSAFAPPRDSGSRERD